MAAMEVTKDPTTTNVEEMGAQSDELIQLQRQQEETAKRIMVLKEAKAATPAQRKEIDAIIEKISDTVDLTKTKVEEISVGMQDLESIKKNTRAAIGISAFAAVLLIVILIKMFV